MTLPELHAELRRLLYAHPLADTNVESVANIGTCVEIETDESGLQAERDEIAAERDQLEKELADAEKEADTAEAERDTLKDLLADLKDPESGITVTAYRERAEAAETEVSVARKQLAIWREEITALRKRKGITANLFANESEILHVLGQCATYPEDAARWQPRAKELLAKIHAR